MIKLNIAFLPLFLFIQLGCQASLKNDRKELNSQISKGLQLIEDRKWGDANKVFSQAASKYPNEFQPYWYMAITSSGHKYYHKAITALQKALIIDPMSKDASFVLGLYLAARKDEYHKEKKYSVELEHHLKKVKRLLPSVGEELGQTIQKIKLLTQKRRALSLTKKINPKDSVLVVLGWALNEKCEMQAPLKRRLSKALEIAKRHSKLKILVTGGDPGRNGCSEAELMASWLYKKGISQKRVLLESKASDTVENAKYSVDLIRDHSFKNIIVLTDFFHLPRAELLFQVRLKEILGDTIKLTMVPAQKESDEDKNRSKKESFSIHRDAARIKGYWMK